MVAGRYGTQRHPHGTRTSTAMMMLHDETHAETNVWNFARMLGDR